MISFDPASALALIAANEPAASTGSAPWAVFTTDPDCFWNSAFFMPAKDETEGDLARDLSLFSDVFSLGLDLNAAAFMLEREDKVTSPPWGLTRLPSLGVLPLAERLCLLGGL